MYVTNFTYGLDRISQTVSHCPGKTESINEGQNTYTDLAVEMYGKLYFHQDRIGSTIRMTKENGQTIAWADYDEWGKVRSPLGHDMNMAGVDNAVGFTSYTYDQVLDIYFAQARMYDAVNRRFMAVDPIKDSVNWYVYCENNPVVFVDPLGLMSTDTLNLITNAYIHGAIDDEDLAMIIMGVNVAHVAIDFVSFVGSIATVNVSKIKEKLKEIDEELQDPNGNRTNTSIYIGFHEIAQVMAAKQIYEQNKTTQYVKNWFMPIPELETRTISGKEVDIQWDKYVWEVKPGYYSDNAFTTSLKKYVSTYDPEKSFEEYADPGFFDKIPGFAFEDHTIPLVKISGVQYNFTVSSKGAGKVGYFFSTDCDDNSDGNGSEIHANQLLPAYKGAFEAAKTVNLVPQVLAFAGGIALAFASPIPGDLPSAVAAFIEFINTSRLAGAH